MNDSFILISPVYNEEESAQGTLETIAAQTRRPKLWMIVDDGSSDGTPGILEAFAQGHDWVRVLTLPREDKGSYSSRARALIRGYREIEEIESQFVAILDFDLRLPPDYYERMLAEFNRDAGLGIAGGLVLDSIVTKPHRPNHVAGGVQMFRRECYDAIGGFRAMPWGGPDVVAGYMAEQQGWRSRTFESVVVDHLRPRATLEVRNLWRRIFRAGRKDHSLAYHPIYALGKSISRVAQRPPVVGVLLRIAGFVWGAAVDRHDVLDADFRTFVRKTQALEMRRRILRAVRLGGRSSA